MMQVLLTKSVSGTTTTKGTISVWVKRSAIDTCQILYWMDKYEF